MRILILGGTRFIGPAVVTELAAAGHEVAVFHRGKSQVELPAGVREIYGDRADLALHGPALLAVQPDVVLDMLAMTEADIRGVIDLFRGHARRLCVISSCDVYRAYGVLIGREQGYLQPTPLTEDSELRPQLYPFREAEPRAADDPRRWLDDYDKILVERAALSEPQLPGVVLRLPMVYGPRDGQHRLFPYLKRMDDNRPAIVLSATDAKRKFARGFVGNVGKAIALAITSDSASGAYNIAEEPVLSELEWVSALAKVAGWGGHVVVIPDAAFPDEQRSQSAQDLAVSTQRIRAELGYSEAVPLSDALAQTVEWERGSMPEPDPAQFDYELEDRLLATQPA